MDSGCWRASFPVSLSDFSPLFISLYLTFIHGSFWDWLDPRTGTEGLPQILQSDRISIRAPGADHCQVCLDNPLKTYPISDALREQLSDRFQNYKRTMRHPTSDTEEAVEDYEGLNRYAINIWFSLNRKCQPYSSNQWTLRKVCDIERQSRPTLYFPSWSPFWRMGSSIRLIIHSNVQRLHITNRMILYQLGWILQHVSTIQASWLVATPLTLHLQMRWWHDSSISYSTRSTSSTSSTVGRSHPRLCSRYCRR